MYPKKKDYTFLIAGIIAVIPVILISAILSFAACKGCTLNVYLQNLNNVISVMSETYYGLTKPGIYRDLANEYTGAFVLCGLVSYAFVAVYIWAGQKNYIRGKEYGTDKYANISAVNNRLKDPDKNNIYHYKYDKYTLLDKFKANIKCEVIKYQKRYDRRKRGVEEYEKL